MPHDCDQEHVPRREGPTQGPGQDRPAQAEGRGETDRKEALDSLASASKGLAAHPSGPFVFCPRSPQGANLRGMSETVQNGPPDPQRQLCAEMFATGTSVEDLALDFNVTERTIRRWLATSECRQVLADIRAASVSAVAGRLVEELRRTLDRLDVLLHSANEPVSLGAVRLKLDVTLKLRAFEEFDGRLSAIEERLTTEGAHA
jgi:transposase-like protein